MKIGNIFYQSFHLRKNNQKRFSAKGLYVNKINSIAESITRGLWISEPLIINNNNFTALDLIITLFIQHNLSVPIMYLLKNKKHK